MRVCVWHLGSVILSLSHFCISAWLMEVETKLNGLSLLGRSLLLVRLWARSSFRLLGITFPSSPSSSSSSSSLWRGVGFSKGLSMTSLTASFSLSNHRASITAAHGTFHISGAHARQITAITMEQRKTIFSNRWGEKEENKYLTQNYRVSDLISISCSVFCEDCLMTSQRSLSLLLHTGAGTNWCTLGATEPWWARLDARSSLRISGTFRISISSSPSEAESHADFRELKNSFSQRRTMLGEGDLTPSSSLVGGLSLETGRHGKVISVIIKNPLLGLWTETVTCSAYIWDAYKLHCQGCTD